MDKFNVNEIDPGVRRLVTWLREQGFDTSDSGDGKHKDTLGWSVGDCLLCLHVVIVVDRYDLADAADQLQYKLQRWLGIQISENTFEARPQIHASYDPVDGSALITLLYVDDSLLPPGIGNLDK